MALQFQPPPDWLVSEYMNRKSPVQEGLDSALKVQQAYAAQKERQQAQQLAQQHQAVLTEKEAREGRAQFYNYGDIASLPQDVQNQIGRPAEGPPQYIPPENVPLEQQRTMALGNAEGPFQPTGISVPPKKSPLIQHFESFLSANPQGIKGNMMTEDNLYIKDLETGALTPSGTSRRQIKGKTIVSAPAGGGGAGDAKKTFQLKGFQGNSPVSYDTRTGAMVVGAPMETPLAPVVAPSIPGSEVSKLGELENLFKKSQIIRENYDPKFVGMLDAPMQALSQKTGFGASTKAANFRQATQDVKDSLLRARSGAQINEQEYQRLLPLVPNESTSEVDFNAKLNRFETMLNEIYSSKKKAFGEAGYRAGGMSGVSGQSSGGNNLDATPASEDGFTYTPGPGGRANQANWKQS